MECPKAKCICIKCKTETFDGKIKKDSFDNYNLYCSKCYTDDVIINDTKNCIKINNTDDSVINKALIENKKCKSFLRMLGQCLSNCKCFEVHEEQKIKLKDLDANSAPVVDLEQ